MLCLPAHLRVSTAASRGRPPTGTRHWLLFTGVLAWRVVLLCAVLGHLAPVHRCARSVRCVACARCPAQLGSCLAVCSLSALCCVCGVLGHLAPVHRCARLACCAACAVSWATWLLFTGAHAWCVVLLCSVLGHWAPVYRSACSVRCVACAVSWATWLLFTGVLAWSVV